MSNLHGYVQVRRGLLEHLMEGKLNKNEFVVYATLLLIADKKTGTAYTCGGGFEYFTGGTISERVAQLCLRALEDKGYIHRFNIQGRVGYYTIAINKYVVTDGLLKNLSLNLSKSELSAVGDCNGLFYEDISGKEEGVFLRDAAKRKPPKDKDKPKTEQPVDAETEKLYQEGIEGDTITSSRAFEIKECACDNPRLSSNDIDCANCGGTL